MSKRILCTLLALSVLALTMTACQSTQNDTSAPEQSTDTTTAVTTTVTVPSDGTTVPTTSVTTTGSTKTEGPAAQPTSKPSTSTTAYTTTRPQIKPLPITPTLFTTKNKTTTKTKSTVKTTTTEEGTRTSTTDPIIDLNGYNFRYANAWYGFNGEPSLYEQELYDRAAEVQDTLNCKISFSSFYPDIESLKTYKMAGKYPADVMEALALQVYPAAAQGYLEPFDPYIESGVINPADERWLQPYNKLGVSPLDGKQYGLRFLRPSDARYCVFYNKTLLAKMGQDPVALCEAAYNGEWDLSMLYKYSTAATDDTDNDGMLNTWGIVGAFDQLAYSFALADGGSIVTVQDGKAVSNLESVSQGMQTFEKFIIDRVIYFPDGAYDESTCDGALQAYDPYEFFLQGNTAFLFAEAWVAEQRLLPNAKFEYGLLPLPLGPGAEVYAAPSHKTHMSVLPTNNKNLDTSILIFNELAKPIEDTAEDMAYVYYTAFQENDLDSLVMYYACLEFASVDLGFSVPNLCDAFLHVAKREALWGQASIGEDPYLNLHKNVQGEIDSVYN